MVEETSAEGDPQSNGAAESSVNVVKGHVRSTKLAVESASIVEVPADHDLLTWLVPYAASMHRRFEVGRDGKTAYERNVGWRAVPPPPWHSLVSECGGCLAPTQEQVVKMYTVTPHTSFFSCTVRTLNDASHHIWLKCLHARVALSPYHPW